MKNTDERKAEINLFFFQQFSKIKEGGWKILLRKLYVGVPYTVRLPIYLLAIPIVLIVRCIRPITLVRFGRIRADVIGDGTFEAEYYLSESELENRKTLDLFYFNTSIMPNEQWAIMIRRCFRIYSFVKYLDYINCLILGGEKNSVRMVSKRTGNRDIKGVLYRTKPHLSFTTEENKRGRDFLEKIGFRETDRFVCIIVRDGAYKEHISSSYLSHKKDWSYHNYRNSDINTYYDAVLTLAKKDYRVIRMGKIVNKPLEIHHPHVLDYANSPYRSDFLDIWLMAHCYFCITTGTGLDDICNTFKRPIVQVNYLTVGGSNCNQRFVIELFKKLKWISNGKYLGLNELFKTGAAFFLKQKLYDDLGVEIVDNTSEEIVNAVIEMEGRLNCTWKETTEDIKLQTIFWEIFKTNPKFADTFGWKHPESRISAHFLRNNHDWFLA